MFTEDNYMLEKPITYRLQLWVRVSKYMNRLHVRSRPPHQSDSLGALAVCFEIVASDQQGGQQQSADQQGYQNHLRALHHAGRRLLHIDLLRETHGGGNG